MGTINSFETGEKILSQFPAVKLLVSMGYEYITPAEALSERQSRSANVLLENILRNQLKKINRIGYKNKEYLFSEENIQSAIQKLKNIKYDGLLRTSEAIYDLITLGTAMEQAVEGDSKSFDLNYVDWKNLKRNRFHVTVEFPVKRSRSTETVKPDIVLFVNGIPFCVIECKDSSVDLVQGVSQSLRNQSEDYIPRLFTYTQIVMAVNKNSATYATTGTSRKFWSIWREAGSESIKSIETKVEKLVNKPVEKSFVQRVSSTLKGVEYIANEERLVTEQDRTIYSLCRPERLLELVWKFILYDGGVKKIARYQQYFVVKSTLNRIKQKKDSSSGKGGIIWHTQGSGKSLTMVMLVRNLALNRDTKASEIVLVTDRTDLDRQLGNTFAACEMEVCRATSGRNLLDLISQGGGKIITTLVHKFDAVDRYRNESSDIFVLVDESHRTQFGSFSAKMRRVFPNASYLGFTGTPLMKKEKNSFIKFGDLIKPSYSMTQAVEDGAVVPLLYEGRHVEMTQNKRAVDLWFERHTKGLSKEQQADLKKKYSRADMLNRAEQVIYMRAFDISEHFRSLLQGTGFKAQLVAPNKAAAIKLHDYLNEIGIVSSAVVISSPDVREGYEDVDNEAVDEVVKFWGKMMNRFGNEGQYNREIISQFKNGSEPEILIVVDKLLTGFDAPKNRVLYLCRGLREHTLLQAIARVNRVCENKDYGLIVDYSNLLGDLDEALTMYSALEGYENSDIAGTIDSIRTVIDKLPTLFSDLLDIFKTVKNSYDEEAYERLLADDDVREEFYSRYYEFCKAFSIALSSEKFLMETDDRTIDMYRNSVKRFKKLKDSVKLRYADAIDFRDYEPRIKKLLDTHIQADEVKQLNEPLNIFDNSKVSMVMEERGDYRNVKTTASKADTIATATKKSIIEKMDEDPAFYEKFSILIQKTIDEFREQRISDLDYLNKVSEIRDKVVNRVRDDVPDMLKDNENAMVWFGILEAFIKDSNTAGGVEEIEIITAEAAVEIERILSKHKKVHFWDDEDAQNRVKNDIDDYLFDELKNVKGVELSLDAMDSIIDKVMMVARHRS